jgi:hypothetical protein
MRALRLQPAEAHTRNPGHPRPEPRPPWAATAAGCKPTRPAAPRPAQPRRAHAPTRRICAKNEARKSAWGTHGARRLEGRGGICVFQQRERSNSDVRRTHLSVWVTNSLRKPEDVRHVGQVASRSGRHDDVGNADLLPNGRGGCELARGEGSQGRWGKSRAGVRGLTGSRCRAPAHGRGPLASDPGGSLAPWAAGSGLRNTPGFQLYCVLYVLCIYFCIIQKIHRGRTGSRLERRRFPLRCDEVWRCQL